MGILDKVGQVAGLAGTVSGGQAGLLQGVLGMLGSSESGGGLANIVKGFEQAGLGGIVSSWIGTGEKLPISAEQVQAGLGANRIEQLAKSAGLPAGATASALASLLPGLIGRLTPDGVVPEAGQLQQLLASSKTAIGG